MAEYKQPKEGDIIYVPSAAYLYRGSEDFAGGKATINIVEYNPNLHPDHYNYIMVGIKERSDVMYNYRYLMEIQEELKAEYGEQIAHPDPDNDPEFNQPNADWK